MFNPDFALFVSLVGLGASEPKARIHRVVRRIVVSPFDLAQGDPEFVEGSSPRRECGRRPHLPKAA